MPRDDGKPNTMAWSGSGVTGDKGEKAGGVDGKLPGGVIQPAKDCGVQPILDKKFLP